MPSHLPEVKYQKYSDVSGFLRSIRRDYNEGKLNEIQAAMIKPSRPIEVLYDIKSDPWEINNLAEDPKFQNDLERLREATIAGALAA